MILVQKTTDCCGCEACLNSCPQSAITMKEDQRGFLYPAIDEQNCIECGRCAAVCEFQKKKLNHQNLPDVYAAVNRNKDDLHTSASGGAFSALARWTLEKNGVVFGCAWNDQMRPVHIPITDISELSRLQGSKYVQSRIGDSYALVKEHLKSGKLVLFSGTPCQCDGLRSYLGKEYDNLICAELICHGVPNARFFREYLDLLEQKFGGTILDVRFRDKKRGWGALLHIVYKNAKGAVRHKYLSTEESYYYYYYWGGNLYRDSCYMCKYASVYRQSDFTIGDYWGIQRANPHVDSTDGASVLLVNTERGKEITGKLRQYLEIVPSTLEAASRENAQLTEASAPALSADELWSVYAKGGAAALEKQYRRRYRKMILKGKLKRATPLAIKRAVKKARNLGR